MPNEVKGFGKIAVGLRYSKACSMFMQSWTQFIQSGLRPGDVVLDIVGDLPHSFAAETLVWHFLQTDCDSILMVDDDHAFGPSILSRLRDNFANHPFDVIGALYAMRRPKYFPVILNYHDASGDFSISQPTEPRGPQACDIVGLGFTLIRREIIQRVKSEYPGDMLFCFDSSGDGEDAFFCRRAKRAGAKIGIDTSVCIAHQFNGVAQISETKAEVILSGEVNNPFAACHQSLRAERKADLERRIEKTKKQQGA